MSAISFSNDTADLTPADTARLFERFWRKDASRTGGVHAGIGLSLARALAQATGWSLSTDVVSEGGRTRVVFVLAGPFSPVTGGDFSRA